MKKLKLRPIFAALAFLGIIALCSFVAICGWLYLVWGNSYAICFGTLTPSYSDIEERAYLRFPPSVRNIEYDGNGVNRKAGCTIWVSFEMAGSDYAAFAKTTRVENFSDTLRLSGDGYDYFSSKKGWIQPQHSLAAAIEFPGIYTVYENQWVFIDSANPDKWKVYLIVNKEWL